MIFLVLLGILLGTPSERVFQVHEVLPSELYLGIKNREELKVGTRLWVLSPSGDTLAQVEVQSVSSQYAFCRILKKLRPIRPGDIAILSIQEGETPPPLSTGAEVEEPGNVPLSPSRGVELKGRVSYGVSGYFYQSLPSYSQNTLRVQVNANPLPSSPFSVSLYLRLRGNIRSSVVSANRNRLYTFSIRYGADSSRFQYQFGRISSVPLIGMGTLDGIVFQWLIHTRFKVGTFIGSGTNTYEFMPDIHRPRGGIFAEWEHPWGQKGIYHFTGAITGQYYGAEISREYVFIQNFVGSPGNWTFQQNAEIDMNRGWRYQKDKARLRLSTFTGTFGSRILPYIYLTLFYRHFRPYWTYESRYVSSLYIDLRNRENLGFRLSSPSLPGKFRSSVQYMLAWQGSGENRNTVISLNFGHPVLTPLKVGIWFQNSWYWNRFSQGKTYTLQFQKFVGHLLQVHLAFGYTRTHLFMIPETRRTSWVQASGYLSLYSSSSLIFSFVQTRGKNQNSFRISVEAGYDF